MRLITNKKFGMNKKKEATNGDDEEFQEKYLDSKKSVAIMRSSKAKNRGITWKKNNNNNKYSSSTKRSKNTNTISSLKGAKKNKNDRASSSKRKKKKKKKRSKERNGSSSRSITVDDIPFVSSSASLTLQSNIMKMSSSVRTLVETIGSTFDSVIDSFLSSDDEDDDYYDDHSYEDKSYDHSCDSDNDDDLLADEKGPSFFKRIQNLIPTASAAAIHDKKTNSESPGTATTSKVYNDENRSPSHQGDKSLVEQHSSMEEGKDKDMTSGLFNSNFVEVIGKKLEMIPAPTHDHLCGPSTNKNEEDLPLLTKPIVPMKTDIDLSSSTTTKDELTSKPSSITSKTTDTTCSSTSTSTSTSSGNKSNSILSSKRSGFFSPMKRFSSKQAKQSSAKKIGMPSSSPTTTEYKSVVERKKGSKSHKQTKKETLEEKQQHNRKDNISMST